MTRPLGHRFYFARRMLVLVSGLLLAWELVGVEVVDLSFPGQGARLRNPGVIPVILAAAVAYFFFLTIAEWIRARDRAPRRVASTLHFRASLAVAAAAFAVFALQRLVPVNLGRLAAEWNALLLSLGAAVWQTTVFLREVRTPSPVVRVVAVLGAVLAAGVLSVMALDYLIQEAPGLTGTATPTSQFATGFLAGGVAAVGVDSFRRGWR